MFFYYLCSIINEYINFNNTIYDMKKAFIVCAAVCAAMAFTSCNSSKESQYRKMYEKAKAQEEMQSQQQVQQPVTTVQQPVQNTPVVTPLESAPAQTTVVADNNDNVPVRQESLQVVSGSGLKAYSVVVGSFGVRANADGLQNRLKSAGYNAQVAYNQERNMYRVVISTFDSKANAVDSRNSIRSTYPDAWLLMTK